MGGVGITTELVGADGVTTTSPCDGIASEAALLASGVPISESALDTVLPISPEVLSVLEICPPTETVSEGLL